MGGRNLTEWVIEGGSALLDLGTRLATEADGFFNRATKVRFWRTQTKQKPPLIIKHLARVQEGRFWRRS